MGYVFICKPNLLFMKRIFYPVILLLTTLALSSQLSAQPYSVIPDSEEPAVADDINPSPIEVGMKFYVTQSGQVTALRFYRGTITGGTYIGHLWEQTSGSSANLLATQAFTPSTSQWNVVTLSTPVTLTPGNTYVVSYYSSDGSYSYTPDYFDLPSDADVGSNPIFGYDADNDPGGIGNGVFLNNAPAGGGFPTTFFAPTNYYADVLFSTFFPLPVTLVDFKANVNNKNVGLTWSTANEENNKGFEIQRSNNNVDWYTVGFVASKGNSSTGHNYSYTDNELASGKYYYRLRQIDIDSRVKLSSTLLANIIGRGQMSLYQNAPNPVRAGGLTAIRFDLPEDMRTRISVVDLTGREVKLVVDKIAQQGSHIVNLDVSGLSKQIYIIRMQTANEVITRKMIVQ
jgi:hypothetical protein